MTEINNINDVDKILETLQNIISNKLENEEKAIRALEVYNKIKAKQKIYKENNKEKIKEISRRHYEKVKNTEEYKERNRQQLRKYYNKNKDKLKAARDNSNTFELLPQIVL